MNTLFFGTASLLLIYYIYLLIRLEFLEWMIEKKTIQYEKRRRDYPRFWELNVNNGIAMSKVEVTPEKKRKVRKEIDSEIEAVKALEIKIHSLERKRRYILERMPLVIRGVKK